MRNNPSFPVRARSPSKSEIRILSAPVPMKELSGLSKKILVFS